MRYNVVMGITTKPTSLRIPAEIILAADEIAKNEERSRAQILVRALRDGLLGGVLNGTSSRRAVEAGNNSRVDERGISGGINNAAVENRVGVYDGGILGRTSEDISAKSRRDVKRGKERQNSARYESLMIESAEGNAEAVKLPFRGPGRCPHGYMNWMVCPECHPREGK